MGYGQYSNEFKGRRTKGDLLRSVDAGYVLAQLWGHNRLYVIHRDRLEYRLHDTAIVTKYNTGEIIVDDGGWPTLTTTAAIKQALTLATGKVCNAWRAGRGKFYVRIGEFERTAPLPLKVVPAELRSARLRTQLRESVDYERARQALIEDACEAQERFSLDELEAYAKETRK